LMNLGRMNATRKEGRESFHSNGRQLPFDLLSYWQWSASDLVSNATMSIGF